MLESFITDKGKFVGCGLLVVVAFSYIFAILNDPRMADGVLSGEDAYWWEIVLIVSGITSVFLVRGAAISQAVKRRRFKWVVMIFLIWPLSLLYGFLVNTKYVEE